jgi:hypothetical protein
VAAIIAAMTAATASIRIMRLNNDAPPTFPSVVFIVIFFFVLPLRFVLCLASLSY